MNSKNRIRYREKLQTGWDSLMRTYTNISYRRKRHCKVSRANTGLLYCTRMSLKSTQKFKHKMKTCKF